MSERGTASQTSRTARPALARVQRVAWIAFVGVSVLGLGLAVCRSSIGWVFPVASGSMEPTIRTGEWVFVRYDDDPPDRFDLVAYTGVGGGASVKRVFGLPNEKFLIEPTGDIRVEGQMLRDDPERPEPVPVFDSDLQSIDEHWRHGGSLVDPWSIVDGTGPGSDEIWEMDGSAVVRGSDLGLLGLHDRVDDGRLLDSGETIGGRFTVHDVSVSFDFMLVSAGGTLRVQLIEQGDVFEAVVPVYEGEPDSRVYLLRNSAFGKEILYSSRTEVPLDEWTSVHFSNLDDRLEFEIGETRLSVEYDRNTPHPQSFDLEPISLGERVRIGGEGVVMRIRSIRVDRDFHVVPRGSFGVGRALLLGPDEIFVMGDASGASQDSRERGPVQLDRLFGRVEAVVWPLRSVRWLN